ncbi:cobaltochelatase subunit CobN [Camelimonas sp. ID_303_24]
MHILASTSSSLDDLAVPVDLGQSPAEMAVLSFSDSDLAGLERAWRAERDAAPAEMPELRLVPLRELRHPMSVDLWIDAVGAKARVVVARILGGLDWWRYGCEQLAATARRHGVALALLPGEDRDDDERLAQLSTVDSAARRAILSCFRAGGPDNLRLAARHMARLAGREITVAEARVTPQAGGYLPGRGAVAIDALGVEANPELPCVVILFYRSMLLADDAAPIDALAAALLARGIQPAPVFVSSLRDSAGRDAARDACARLKPAALVTATAFAAAGADDGPGLFAELGVPVFQVIVATTRRSAWADGQRGLTPADTAMHVALPEVDGRALAGALSFKDAASDQGAASGGPGETLRNMPEPDRVEAVADRICAHIRLQRTPAAARRLAIMVPDYPGVEARSGYAVGLDAPESALAILADLASAGYAIADIPADARALMLALERPQPAFSAEDYLRHFNAMPETARDAVIERWGPPPAADAPDFNFRAAPCGAATVVLAPDRGEADSRRADYHDGALPPHHNLLAFGFWLQHALAADAVVHVGAHGAVEWLPGKTVALTGACWPQIVFGPLPVIYPFIVSNPGEAAQAKRRIGALTLGHLTPPLIAAGTTPAMQALERLVDEYASAESLDPRRRDLLAGQIVAAARDSGLAREAGVDVDGDAVEALQRIDAWLCDLKDFPVKDGLHVYGRACPEAPPERAASAESALHAESTLHAENALRAESAVAESTALLTALDGCFVAPGPAGAPARGRADVLPTGRNLFAVDPRAMPTPTAFALGKAAAEQLVLDYLQRHGDWPRAMVIDLWGSASLRTGGEEISMGLALMGCRPDWDHATGRVTGVEVLPPASFGRPRVDVSWRISGLFRDMFPSQIALLDAATAAVAAREESDDDNPLAASVRAGATAARVFGAAPGVYGAGVEHELASGQWETREQLGQRYLETASHAYGGLAGDGVAAPGVFAARVAAADVHVHPQDDPGRDLLEGSADVAFIGGFAAARALQARDAGEVRPADIVVLDTTNPASPRARSLAAAIARVVRARAVNPAFIAGQMRHGPRGASELAETVDRLVAFAETTGCVPGSLLDAVHDAYLGDAAVLAFLRHNNPAAVRVIARRFADARRRGLWHPRRNSIDDDLAALMAQAGSPEAQAEKAQGPKSGSPKSMAPVEATP